MTIGLMSNEQVLFQVEDSTGLQFDYVVKRKHVLFMGRELNDGGSVFFLMFLEPYFSTRALKKVLEWAIEHKDEPPLAPNEKVVLSKFDEQFFEMDDGLLFDCFLIVDHLGHKRLRELACQYVARSISGKTPDAVRAFFGSKMGADPRVESLIKLNLKFQEEKNAKMREWAELQKRHQRISFANSLRKFTSISDDLGELLKKLKLLEEKQKTLSQVTIEASNAGPSSSGASQANTPPSPLPSASPAPVAAPAAPVAKPKNGGGGGRKSKSKKSGK